MFKFFMVALPHSNAAELESWLKQYIIEGSEYIIGLEICSSHKETDGQHFHIAVEMDDKIYDTFRKSVLVNHYKLRGRATKGLPRQYGIVKQVRDETKFLAYTVKDQNIITNITDKSRLNKYIEQSYKREEKQTFEKSVFEYLDAKLPPFDCALSTTYPIQLKILDYYRNNTDKLPALSTLKYLSLKYLFQKSPFEHSTESILNLMYNK